jgi:lauroyl/myristoyl acyltransferase
VTIEPDAVWEKRTAYRRPFAGAGERGFAVGVARMSRLSQCPIVLLKAVCGPEARVVRVEWGAVIEPQPIENKDSDPRTMDRILDFIETGIGRDPTEYSLPIGWERHWNPALERWEP